MLPFSLPVAIICVLFLVFWIAPLISKRIKLPSIILFILFGILVGPHGLHILDNDSRIKLLADIGIMFIMFLAGLELNPNQIKSNKRNTVSFGAMVFIIPISLGFSIFHFILGYPVTTSLLISLMFSTQTLVAFPIVSRLGLTNKRSVITAVGGTIITDAAVLFSIGLIVTSAKYGLDWIYLIKFLSMLLGFVFVVVFVFPLIVKKFFNKYYEETEYSNFSLVIFLLFLAGTLAHFAGLEPIIGAFLVGIMLNKYIPNNSSLLSNLNFIGNGIFIPMFLFYVGMLIDYKSALIHKETLLLAAILTATALTGKLSVSFIAGKIFKFSNNEIGLLFGLSSAHAAVVIATALIGYNIGLISTYTLNATVILVLLSCISSSLVTEYFGKKVVIAEKNPNITTQDGNERIIVPYANPNTIDKLLGIATNIAYPDNNSIIYPLTVVQENDQQYKETISINRSKIMEMSNTYSKDITIRPISRIDINPISGINRVVKELIATILIIGWTGRIRKSDILGKNINSIISNNDIQTIICHIEKPLTSFKEIVIIVPRNAEFEKGFTKWMHSAMKMAQNTNLPLHFYGTENSITTIKEYYKNNSNNLIINYHIDKNVDDNVTIDTGIFAQIKPTSLLIVIFAHESSISYEASSVSIINALQSIQNYINFLVIIPEQYSIDTLPHSNEIAVI